MKLCWHRYSWTPMYRGNIALSGPVVPVIKDKGVCSKCGKVRWRWRPL